MIKALVAVSISVTENCPFISVKFTFPLFSANTSQKRSFLPLLPSIVIAFVDFKMAYEIVEERDRAKNSFSELGDFRFVFHFSLLVCSRRAQRFFTH